MAFGLNIFKTITFDLETISREIYTAPVGYSAIVLMCQVSNVTGGTEEVSASVLNLDSSETSLVENFSIPSGDSAGLLTGKLVLEEGFAFSASASTNGALKLVLSILESKN
jgi:hypothetical protein